jgi:FAD/FMN-containing dehydrogenase
MHPRTRAIAGTSVAAIALAVFVAVHKAFVLAADPQGPKDCRPLSPEDADPSRVRVITDATALPDTLPWSQKGGLINDASCLDATAVTGIVQVNTEEDIHNALTFAKERGLALSIAAVKHSMGGQAFARGAVVLDMTHFNAITMNEAAKTITVQPGATWHDIQLKLHPRFAVKAMQSTDIFSVGGSISVNAHGMDHRSGSVVQSLRSMRVLLPDGRVVTASPTENPEIFRAVAGGYGLFGVILEATLDIVDNDVYASERATIDAAAFPETFRAIDADDDIGLFYGHLSTSPGSFLREMILYTYRKTEIDPATTLPPLADVGSVKLRRLTINLSKRGAMWQRLKWWSEKHIEPRIESCSIPRTAALGLGEACLVSRNEPMHDSVPYLRNTLKGETDILHEYFIPRENIVAFIDDAREILRTHDANLLNASVRAAHADDILLSYAPNDAFALVLYINQRTTPEGNENMRALTSDLIDASTRHGGRFFLPYQLHYTREQLRAAYPNFAAFAAFKKTIDPQGLLTNTWWERYGA